MDVLTNERLEEIVATHVDDWRAEQLLSLAQPALRLLLERDSSQPAGSRIGGLPLLPSDAEWPVWQSRPLSFLCQLRIGDLRQQEQELAQDGLLSFFYELEEQPWGFDPADRGGWQTTLVNAPASASLRDAPEDAFTTPERSAALVPEPTLPHSGKRSSSRCSTLREGAMTAWKAARSSSP